MILSPAYTEVQIAPVRLYAMMESFSGTSWRRLHSFLAPCDSLLIRQYVITFSTIQEAYSSLTDILRTHDQHLTDDHPLFLK